MTPTFKQPSTYAGIAAVIAGIPEFAAWVGPVKLILAGVIGLAAVLLNEGK